MIEVKQNKKLLGAVLIGFLLFFLSSFSSVVLAETEWTIISGTWTESGGEWTGIAEVGLDAIIPSPYRLIMLK